MKRPLSSLLALALVLGSVPAQAQTALVRAPLQAGVRAPVPVPTGLVPAAGVFTPVLSAPVLAGAPALAPSAPSAVLPARPASVVPAFGAAAPAPAPAPALAQAGTEAPLDALRRASLPGPALALDSVFDGSRSRSAPASVEPSPAPPAAARPRRGLLQRYRERRAKTPLQAAFGEAMFVTAMTAAAAPVLWDAAPAMKLLYAVTAADILMLAILLPLAAGAAAWRKLRRTPQTAAMPPPGRRARFAALAAGVLLGLGAAVAPYQATGPVVQAVRAVEDMRSAPEKQERVRWISGGAVEDETIKALSLNPVGRDILDSLRDRGGVVRLPAFFVSRQDDSYAQHEGFFSAVYLSEGEITGRGWTVEQFLADPALQRRLVREMTSTVVHELTHAVQARRPPWTTGYFRNSTEAEQEAFFREMLFRLAELERDPGARNDGHDRWMIPDAADDLDGFLKEVAGMYEKNVVVGEPYFAAFLAEQRARWPVFRVHMYQVLAARADTPASANMYMDKAKAAAKEAGLSEPAPLVASR